MRQFEGGAAEAGAGGQPDDITNITRRIPRGQSGTR